MITQIPYAVSPTSCPSSLCNSPECSSFLLASAPESVPPLQQVPTGSYRPLATLTMDRKQQSRGSGGSAAIGHLPRSFSQSSNMSSSPAFHGSLRRSGEKSSNMSSSPTLHGSLRKLSSGQSRRLSLSSQSYGEAWSSVSRLENDSYNRGRFNKDAFSKPSFVDSRYSAAASSGKKQSSDCPRTARNADGGKSNQQLSHNLCTKTSQALRHNEMVQTRSVKTDFRSWNKLPSTVGSATLPTPHKSRSVASVVKSRDMATVHMSNQDASKVKNESVPKTSLERKHKSIFSPREKDKVVVSTGRSQSDTTTVGSTNRSTDSTALSQQHRSAPNLSLGNSTLFLPTAVGCGRHPAVLPPRPHAPPPPFLVPLLPLEASSPTAISSPPVENNSAAARVVPAAGGKPSAALLETKNIGGAMNFFVAGSASVSDGGDKTLTIDGASGTLILSPCGSDESFPLVSSTESAQTIPKAGTEEQVLLTAETETPASDLGSGAKCIARNVCDR